MSEKLDLFKAIAGVTEEEYLRLPDPSQTFDAFWKKLKAKDKIFSLGYSVTQGDQWITEGERSLGFHVLGSTREGKSKFLEYIVRHDIDRLAEDEELIYRKKLNPKDRRSLGLLFIDPSAGGDTNEKILAYCAKVGFTKVILIDPHRIKTYGKVPPINPFFMPIRRLTESFRVIFDVKDANKISNIETYLRAIFNVLRSCRLTLADVYPFTFAPDHKDFDKFAPERREILGRAKGVAAKLPFSRRRVLEKNIYEVDLAYRNYTSWRNEIASTVRRMNVIFQSEISQLIYGHRGGLDFQPLVSDGWVILVSVSDEHLDDLESRLLATLVINNVIFAIERIRRKGFDRPYHLFIDEAGEYATTQLAKVLNYKQKILLWPVLAHQHLSQLRDKDIADAVENGTKIKASFYIEKPVEREAIVRLLGYGGELTPKEVAWALRDQEKREMVLKIGKRDPVVCRVYDTPDAQNNEQFIKDYILSSDNYVTEQQIEQDYAKRFGYKQTHTKPARPSRTPDRKTANRDDVPAGLKTRRTPAQQGVAPEQSVPKSNEGPGTTTGGRSRKF